MSKDARAADVITRLNGLIDALRGNIGQLNAILEGPAPGGGENDERLVEQ